MKDKVYLKIIQQVAKEHKISVSLATKIIEYPFKFTRKVMGAGAFNAVMMPYLGKFLVKIKRLQNYNDRKGKPRFHEVIHNRSQSSG